MEAVANTYQSLTFKRKSVMKTIIDLCKMKSNVSNKSRSVAIYKINTVTF